MRVENSTISPPDAILWTTELSFCAKSSVLLALVKRVRAWSRPPESTPHPTPGQLGDLGPRIDSVFSSKAHTRSYFMDCWEESVGCRAKPVAQCLHGRCTAKVAGTTAGLKDTIV